MNFAIIIGLIIILFLVFNVLLPHIVKIIWRQQFLHQIRGTGKIYLTFDDGPDPSNTKEILELLKDNNIKATFFVIGEKAKNNEELIKRMIYDGHKVCTHGNNHLHPWKVLPWRAMTDLIQGNKILREYGIKCKYARPPYGKLNFFTLLYFLFAHLTFVHWDIDSLDYRVTNPERLGEWLKQRIETGKIILLHDGRRVGTSPGEITLKCLEIFFKDCKFDSQIFSTLL